MMIQISRNEKNVYVHFDIIVCDVKNTQIRLCVLYYTITLLYSVTYMKVVCAFEIIHILIKRLSTSRIIVFVKFLVDFTSNEVTVVIFRFC